MREAALYTTLENRNVKCFLCPHACVLAPGKRGICGVRKNIDGILQSLNYKKISAINIDPVEKKPLYHFLPGTDSFSISAPGCNFHCNFCQNSSISMVKNEQDITGREISPSQLVKKAKEGGCRSISYTYTEPTIYFELMKDTAEIAASSGLKNIMVSNGFITHEALDLIAPYIDAANIDIKSFSNDFYKKYTGGSLKPVLDTVRKMKDMGIWVEVTTLLIPGLNTEEEEIKNLTRFILGTDPDIPWHMSRFFPSYRLTEIEPTDPEKIKEYLANARDMGLSYVYGGNFISNFWESTHCPSCGSLLIQREGYNTEIKNLSEGKCSICSMEISGVWD